jgi:hypothetical protein
VGGVEVSKRTSAKEYAIRNGIISVENLPLSRVLYPGICGVFFGFMERDDSPLNEIRFCSCAKEAIENYVKHRLSGPRFSYADPTRMFILDSMHFPYAVVKALMNRGLGDSDGVVRYLNFEDRLCHECNSAVPKYLYCWPGGGGLFRKTYGWYILKQAYEFGIRPWIRVIPEACPQEVLDRLNLDPICESRRTYELIQSGRRREAERIHKALQQQQMRIQRLVENEVRRKFGHKRIGETWTSETLLYYSIMKLFPDLRIHRHYRPGWLEGLELHVYIEGLQVGIEYQGIQHFKPVKHWGGEKAFSGNQERDRRKAKICSDRGIPIVYFRYDEGLSNDYIIEKLKPYLHG